ncbi:MAG: hypothetical protein SGJ11_01240 [Phycisphaerae bacterium]|nr:hypothetical protein [Phycisphaerae bacterium]
MTFVRTHRDPFAVTLASAGDVGLALLQTCFTCFIPLTILVLPFVGNTLKTRAGRWIAPIFAIPIIGLGAWLMIGEMRGIELVQMDRSAGPHFLQLQRLSGAVATQMAEGASSERIRAELREDLAWVAEDGSPDHSRQGLDVPYGWSVTEDGQGRPVVTLYDLTAMPVVFRFGPDGEVVTD